MSKIIQIIVVIIVLLYIIENRKRKTPPVYYKKSLLGGYNARTLPPFGIYISEQHKGNEALLEHEMKHWEQYEASGVIGYYLSYLYNHLAYGYDANPMEVTARTRESAYCKQNYTECVRNGTAVTIHNKNFRNG